MRLSLACAALISWHASPAVAAPNLTPLERYNYDQLEETTFETIFHEDRRGGSGPRVFLIVGDLDDPIGSQRYRPDAVIVPTNTSAELEAAFPITQRTYVDRARKNAAAMGALRRSIESERSKVGDYAFLPLGIGSVTATLPQPGGIVVPRSVCLLATDNRGGGSIRQRDFFHQRLLRKGVGNCLSALERAAVRSVATPLVGSALFATADGALDGNERGLVKCRMLNSISGIAQAVGDLPKTTQMRDVAIILWRHDLDRLFGKTRTDQRRDDFARFAAQAKASLTRGLKRQPTTVKAVNLPQCQHIFGPVGR